MTENIYEEKKIKVIDLNLWSENPRFPPKYYNKPQNELIDYLVSVSSYDIKILAREIVDEFDLPQFEKLAVFSNEGKLISLEGNRRLTAYKLLINPKLTSHYETRIYFEELKAKISINDTFKLECITSKDFNGVIKYVERKHLKNNNEKPWGQIERGHAKYILLDNNSKKVLLEKELFQIVNDLDISELEKDNILGKGFVTSFFRIVGSSSAFEVLKLYFNTDKKLLSEDSQFHEKLKQIISDVLNKKVYKNKIISRLNTEDIKDYLESIKIEIIPTTKPSIESPTSSNDNKIDNETPLTQRDSINDIIPPVNNSNNIDDKPVIKTTSDAITPTPAIRANPSVNSRTKLIPRKPALKISSNKINNIYIELRDHLTLSDSKNSVPNAVGVLFRVFLEVSLDYYALKKMNGHLFAQNDNISKKIEVVTSHMLTLNKYKKSEFENIRSVGSSSKYQTYLSIEKFHQYVHSTSVEPTSGELKSKWNHLSGFFIILWDEINIAENK